MIRISNTHGAGSIVYALSVVNWEKKVNATYAWNTCMQTYGHAGSSLCNSRLPATMIIHTRALARATIMLPTLGSCCHTTHASCALFARATCSLSTVTFVIFSVWHAGFTHLCRVLHSYKKASIRSH